MAEKKVTKKKTTTKTEEEKKKESIFYVGPGVQRGILDKGATFIGDLPKEVEELKKTYPSIAPLFVSKDEYVTAFNEINQPGTTTNILFNKAVGEVMN